MKTIESSERCKIRHSLLFSRCANYDKILLSLERTQRCGAILSSSAFITQRIPLQAELSTINNILQQCKNEIISVLRDIYSLFCNSHSLPSNAYTLPENEVSTLKYKLIFKLVSEILKISNQPFYSPESPTISSVDNSNELNMTDNSPSIFPFLPESQIDALNMYDSTDFTYPSDPWDNLSPTQRFPDIAIPRISYPIPVSISSTKEKEMGSPNSPFAVAAKPPDFETFQIDDDSKEEEKGRRKRGKPSRKRMVVKQELDDEVETRGR